MKGSEHFLALATSSILWHRKLFLLRYKNFNEKSKLRTLSVAMNSMIDLCLAFSLKFGKTSG